jgi:chemotaxis protein MotB
MTRSSLVMAFVAVAGLMSSTGCYYDQWQQSQRALRTMTEHREKLANDLHDAEALLAQKNTQIESLQNQLSTEQQRNASLTSENQGLRNALGDAQGIAKTMADKQFGDVTIINRSLPAEVDSALTDLMHQYPDLLEKVGNSIRWKSDLLFPLGSDQMSTSDRVQEALRKFAEIINSAAAQGLELVIVGHTDTTRIAKPETLKEHKTNWHLSAHRAIAIMRLLAGLGVGEPRMGVMGYGELRPIADNSSEAGKAKNRRVEIYLVPKGSITGTGSAGVHNSDQTGPFVKPSEVTGTPGRTPARTAERRAPRTTAGGAPTTPARAAAPAPAEETLPPQN